MRRPKRRPARKGKGGRKKKARRPARKKRPATADGAGPPRRKQRMEEKTEEAASYFLQPRMFHFKIISSIQVYNNAFLG